MESTCKRKDGDLEKLRVPQSGRFLAPPLTIKGTGTANVYLKDITKVVNSITCQTPEVTTHYPHSHPGYLLHTLHKFRSASRCFLAMVTFDF